MTQISLTWDSYSKNICDGFSALQQNGEFVDMTLAADGCMVQVHRVVLAFASPYFKEIISSTQCTHPVIFLSKISYDTLCSILEYIYTGEVHVPIAKLSEFITAGIEMRIKGLDDNNLHKNIFTDNHLSNIVNAEKNQGSNENGDSNTDEYTTLTHTVLQSDLDTDDIVNTRDNRDMDPFEEPMHRDDEDDERDDSMAIADANDTSRSVVTESNTNQDTSDMSTVAMQYTLSNQGSLQLILNRYVYFLRYVNREQVRQWRCVEYVRNRRCPACVFTKNDVVIKRVLAHNHPFHDKKILQKLRNGNVFSAIKEAEKEVKVKKLEREANKNCELRTVNIE